jgi:tRNA G46 methylase TrmB
VSDDRKSEWRAPPASAGLRGVSGGSRLFEQPQYRRELETFERFIAGPGPLAVEIGFDKGVRLLDHARRFPDWKWIGLEVRERQVLRVAPHAPDNCLVWRVDARTVFGVLMPARRVDRVDILFPTPWWDEGRRAKRLLVTAEFRDHLSAAMAAEGKVHVATDVGPYFDHVAGLFHAWRSVEAPPAGPALSRRERVCKRDGLPTWSGTWSPPA